MVTASANGGISAEFGLGTLSVLGETWCCFKARALFRRVMEKRSSAPCYICYFLSMKCPKRLLLLDIKNLLFLFLIIRSKSSLLKPSVTLPACQGSCCHH